MYGRQPNGLFIPANLAPEFVAGMDELQAVHTGEHTIEPGVVLDMYDGMAIKLCTGERLGVGTVAKDFTTPPHPALYLD